MGSEATCTMRFDKRTSTGRARLETTVLQIRGEDTKIDLPFTTMSKVVVENGWLSITHAEGRLSLELGGAAQKWADKILHPPSRLTKIGVKPDWNASAIGPFDSDFVAELRAAAGALSIGRVAPKSDAIFFAVVRAADLKRLDKLRRALKPNGALWIVRPKGHAELTERAVMVAGKAAGLVDVKVVGFSSTHTAEKFVIPVKNRPNPKILKS